MRIYVGFLLVCIFAVGIYGAGNETTSTAESVSKTTKVTTSSQSPSSPPTTTSTLPPTTTTEAPTTTPKTTTVVTTKEPEPTTTTEAPTTEPATTASPTESPTPSVGNWTVSDVNVTCIKAEMGVRVIVDHLGPFANESITHNLSPSASSGKSQCNYEGRDAESLVLEDGDYVLQFIFAHNKEEFFVQNISVSFTEGKEDVRAVSGKYFAANTGNSYLCSKQDDIKFQNVTLKFAHLQIQAFGTTNSTEFRKGQECYADEKMNDIVPIAVAAVLCGMVVVILIGYLIGRRQTRPRGYQQM